MGLVLCVCVRVCSCACVRACFSAAIDLWNATEHLSSSYKDPCFNWRGYEHVALSFNGLLWNQWEGTYFRSSEELAWIRGVSTECPNTAPSEPCKEISLSQSDSSGCFWHWAESARFTSDGELLGGHEELVLAGGEQHSVPVLVSYLQPLTLGLDSLRSCTETPTHVGPSEF